MDIPLFSASGIHYWILMFSQKCSIDHTHNALPPTYINRIDMLCITVHQNDHSCSHLGRQIIGQLDTVHNTVCTVHSEQEFL